MAKKKLTAILLVWSFIHGIILLFDEDPFNQSEEYDHFSEVFYPIPQDGKFPSISDYDMREFVVYAGGAWFIYFLFYYLKNDKKVTN